MREKIKHLNELKKVFSLSTFKRKAFVNALRDYQFPNAQEFFDELIKQGFIEKTTSGFYFKYKNPIVLEALEKMMKNVRKRKADDFKKYFRNKKQKNTKQSFIASSENLIENAIKLLKNNGYKILKPITNFEEI